MCIAGGDCRLSEFGVSLRSEFLRLAFRCAAAADLGFDEIF